MAMWPCKFSHRPVCSFLSATRIELWLSSVCCEDKACVIIDEVVDVINTGLQAISLLMILNSEVVFDAVMARIILIALDPWPSEIAPHCSSCVSDPACFWVSMHLSVL